MHLKIDRQTASDAVKRLSPLLRANESFPELSGILLETGADGVSVTATARNEIIAARLEFPALVLEEGCVVINGKLLAAIIERLGNHYAELRTVGQGNILVSSGSTEYTLATRPVKNYPKPEIPQVETALSVAGLPRHLRRCVFAVGHDAAMPAYSKVKIDAEGSELIFTATDTKGLVQARAPVDAAAPLHCLIPDVAALYLAGVFSSKDNVQIGPAGNQTVFRTPALLVCVQQSTEAYLDVKTLLDGFAPEYLAQFKAADFIAALRVLQSVESVQRLAQLQIGNGFIALESKGDKSTAHTQFSAAATTAMPGPNYYFSEHLLAALTRFGDGQVQLAIANNGMLRMQTEEQLYLLVPTKPLPMENPMGKSSGKVSVKAGKSKKKAA